MKKIMLMLMMVAGLCFAGNFEKSSDTTSHSKWVTKYDYSYVEDDYVEPTPVVVIYKRTAPDHCVNVNCKERQRYNHHPKNPPKQKKRYIKVIRKD